MATPRINYASRTFDTIKADLIAAIDQFLPEWTDHSDTDMGIVILELFAYVGDLLSFHTNNIANEALFETATEPASILSMAKMLNYSVSSQQPAVTQVFFTLSATVGVATVIPAGTAIRKSDDATVVFETVADLTIPAGQLGNEQTLPGTYDYQVEAKNYTQVTGEIVGSIQPRGDGSLDFLEMQLLQFPVTKSSIEIQVHDGVSFVVWNRQELFVNSTPTDKDFTVTLDVEGKATIRFGNGVLGALPEVGVDNVRANYAFGGLGSLGNGVPVGGLNQLVNPIPNVALVSNISVTTGGEDFGTVDQLKKELPFTWSALDRAVVDQDYEALAKSGGGVAKSSAVFNEDTGAIDIYALPTGGGFLTAPQKATLLAYLESKSVLGRTIVIKDPYYVDVDGVFEVSVFPNYDEPTVLAAVSAALSDLFAFDNRELAQSEFISNVFSVIEAIEGVNFVDIPEFHRRSIPRADADNTGQISFSTITTNISTQPRIWDFTMISATVFEVASGVLITNGTLGVPFDNGEIAFTATAGVPAPVTGDHWTIRTSAFNGNVLADDLEILQEGTFTVS